MSQSDMFRPSSRPPQTRHDAPGTSREAAHFIAGSVSRLQRLVLDYIINHRGTTDREMVADLRKEHGGSESTYRTRRAELVDLGLVKQLGTVSDGAKRHRTWAATEEAFRK